MNTTSVSQRLPRPHKSTTPANDASASRKSFPTGITICVLEEDASALEIVSRLLLSAGYQVHLPKPVEPSQLAQVVGTLAGRSPGLN